jgi:Uma2 family endonuclease
VPFGRTGLDRLAPDITPEEWQRMAAPIHRDPLVEQILEVHAGFEPPEGHKAEVIGGNIVVSPTPSGRHGLIFDRLHRQLVKLLPTHLAVTNNITVDMTATGERYIPDLLVVHEETLLRIDWLLDPAEVELVAAIVSPSNSRHDRVVKVRGYAACAVPIYLLIDPLEQAVTLFFEPHDGAYQQVHRVPFGAGIALPEPYSGKIDTSVLG